jgi:hypothetical protein
VQYSVTPSPLRKLGIKSRTDEAVLEAG